MSEIGIAAPALVNGLTIKEIEKSLLPCPFCGCEEINYGKTNNCGDFDQWVAVCICSECKSQSYIWNAREAAKKVEEILK